MSLNAAIFASVCLASRLPTTRHAFATVTFAVVMFALWPELRRRFRVKYTIQAYKTNKNYSSKGMAFHFLYITVTKISMALLFQDSFPSSHNVLTVILGVSTVLALGSISVTGAVLFTLTHLFVTFVCPAWLIKLQPYKK